MHMKAPLFFLLLCCFAFCQTSATAQSSGDAGEAYLRGYTLKNESEKLEAAGKMDAALAEYRQAFQIISSVAQNFPEWQPEVVRFRLESLQKKIDALQMKAGVTAPLQPSPFMPSGGLPIPLAPAAPLSPPVVAGSELPPTNDPFEMMRRRDLQKDATIQQLRDQTKMLQDAYIAAASARQKAETDIGTLQKQQGLLQQQVSGAEQAIKAAAASGKAAAQEELTRLRNEQRMVQDMISGKNTALEEANKSLAELKKNNEQLSAQNMDLKKQTKDLQTRVTTLETSGMKSEDFSKLVSENTRLKGELEATRKQVDELKTSTTKKDTEIAQLRTNLSSIQTQLAQLRSENSDYQKQVADLTVKLKGLNASLAKNPAKGGAKDSKLSDENNMLRTIILRQLRQQERQREAKELVIAEMKHMENSSKAMMDNIEEMASAKIIITLDEEKLFTEPERDQIYAANNVRAATLMFDSKKESNADKPGEPAKELPKDAPSAEEKLLVQAGAALDKGDFAAAEAAFQDALRANPKNASARTSLASLKLRQKKFDDAEVELKKCLVYEPDNDTALYYLGVCYYGQSKMDEAVASFEKSLSRKPANAVAHHYLGIIASKGGKRDRAETEFKQALAIDPGYGDAHFNLAVLYATSEPPNMDLAKQHYKDALDRGIKADPAMEKLLKKTDGPKAKIGTAVSAR